MGLCLIIRLRTSVLLALSSVNELLCVPSTELGMSERAEGGRLSPGPCLCRRRYRCAMRARHLRPQQEQGPAWGRNVPGPQPHMPP